MHRYHKGSAVQYAVIAERFEWVDVHVIEGLGTL